MQSSGLTFCISLITKCHHLPSALSPGVGTGKGDAPCRPWQWIPRGYQSPGSHVALCSMDCLPPPFILVLYFVVFLLPLFCFQPLFHIYFSTNTCPCRLWRIRLALLPAKCPHCPLWSPIIFCGRCFWKWSCICSAFLHQRCVILHLALFKYSVMLKY